MGAEDRVHVGVFQHPLLDHLHRALDGLFGGLEAEFDPALQLVLVLFEQLGGPQQGGGVDVVPAGVHGPILGLEGLVGLLGHGQGVHVGAHQQHLAIGLFAGHGHKAAGADVLHLVPHLGEALFHVGSSEGQFKAQLGVLVQIAAVGHHLVLEFPGAFQQGMAHCKTHSFLRQTGVRSV